MAYKFLFSCLVLIILSACANPGPISPGAITPGNTMVMSGSDVATARPSQTVTSGSTVFATKQPPPIPQSPPNQLTLLDQVGNGTAEQIAWSPDGQSLAVAGSLGITRYNATDFKLESVLRSRFPLIALAFAPNSQKLALINSNKHVEIWEYPSGKLLSDLPLDGNTIVGFDFSADGRRLIAGTDTGLIWLIDVASGHVLRKTQALTGDLSLLAVSRSTGLVAAADAEYHIHLLDLTTLQPLAELTAHNETVVAMAFNKGGTLLASASEDGALVLWDVKSPLRPHIIKVIGAAYLPYLSAPSYLWDPHSYTAGNSWSPALAISPDDKWILAGALDGVGREWALDFDRSETFYSADRSAAFSPDGTKLASIGPTSAIQIFSYDSSDPYSKETLSLINEIATFSGPIQSLTVSSDSQTILTSDDRGFHSWKKDCQCLLWEQNNVISVQSLFETFYHASASDPGMAKLVAGGIGGSISVWDGTTGQFQQTFVAHPHIMGLNGTPSVESALFSPDGRYLASIGAVGDVRVWDSRDFHRISGDVLTSPFALAFDPSGDLLAIACWDHMGADASMIVEVVDPATFGVVAQIPMQASSIAISAEKDAIVIGDQNGGFSVFSLPDAKLLVQSPQGGPAPTSIAFLAGHQFLVLGTQDGFVELWNVASSHLIARVEAHKGPVTHLELTNNNRTLFTGSEDGTVKMWNLGK